MLERRKKKKKHTSKQKTACNRLHNTIFMFSCLAVSRFISMHTYSYSHFLRTHSVCPCAFHSYFAAFSFSFSLFHIAAFAFYYLLSRIKLTIWNVWPKHTVACVRQKVIALLVITYCWLGLVLQYPRANDETNVAQYKWTRTSHAVRVCTGVPQHSVISAVKCQFHC